MLTIACALKIGNGYTHKYVDRMSKALKRVLTEHEYRLVCFSNKFPESMDGTIYASLPQNLESWWSKLACFSLSGPVLYFDLDTVFISSIDNLAREVIKLSDKQFLMLTPMRAGESWASGIMGWNGSHSYLLSEYCNMDRERYVWDQRYIARKLHMRQIEVKPVQFAQPGIYSFKRHCRRKKLPGASIVLFHGHPRPHEVLKRWPNSWIKEYWDD